jgi:hypothetical protein
MLLVVKREWAYKYMNRSAAVDRSKKKDGWDHTTPLDPTHPFATLRQVGPNSHLGAPPPLWPASPLEPVPAVKYVVDVPDLDGELLLPRDLERRARGRAGASSPSSLAPAARSISGVSHSRLGAHELGATSCSPCSVTGASTSFAPWLLLRPRGGSGAHPDSAPQELPLPPLPGRAEAEPGRGWPRARRASRTSSPSSEGMRGGRWILLLRLEAALALARLALAASLKETIVPAVGGREEVEDDGATPPQALLSALEWRLASSREPTEEIVGMRRMTPPNIGIGSSVWTSRPNSSMDM